VEHDAMNGAATSVRQSSRIASHRVTRGRLTTIVVISAGVLLIAVGLLLDARAILSNAGWRNSTDFGGYQMAAYAFAAGQDPYAERVEFAGVEMGYQYPPAFALAMLVPLSVFGPDLLRWIWSGFVAASLGAALVLLFRAFGPPVAWRWTVLAIGLLGLSRLVRSEIYHGQADLPLLLLIVLSLLWLRSGRHLAVGCALGVCAVVKPFLGILAIWLIWRGNRRAGLAAIVVSGALFVLSLAVLSSGAAPAFWGWREETSYMVSPSYIAFLDNNAAFGLLARLFADQPFAEPWVVSPALRLAAEICVGLVLFAVFAAAVPFSRVSSNKPNSDGRLLLVEAGIALGLALIFGPLMEGSHIMFFLPLIVAVGRLTLDPAYHGDRAWLSAAACWCVVAIQAFLPVATILTVDSSVPDARPSGLAVLASWRIGALVLLAVIMSARALIHARVEDQRDPGPAAATPSRLTVDV